MILPRLPLAAIALFLAATAAASPARAEAGAAAPGAPALTPKDMERSAQDTVKELQGSTKKVLGLIEAAQKNKDFVLLNCLNDKLIQLRGLQKVAEDASFGLSEAIARENGDAQEHNYRKVTVAKESAAKFAAEADNCIGELGSALPGGGTRVVVTVDGGAAGDGGSGSGAPAGGGSRPPDASEAE